jgi:hypothetical protein
LILRGNRGQIQMQRYRGACARRRSPRLPSVPPEQLGRWT